jgi:hypothetical protein
MKKVLIIPWFSAKNKHINVYVKMYKRLGYNVDIMKYKVYDGITMNGLNSIKQRKHDYLDPDIIHTFSGGPLILHAMSQGSNSIDYDKLIIDSGPIFPSSKETANYISLLTYLSNKDLIERYINKYWKSEQHYDENLEKKFKTWLLLQNTLCILGNEDKYIDRNKVTNWINYNNVQHKIFKNAGHCDSYRYNKEEYIELIKTFL